MKYLESSFKYRDIGLFLFKKGSGMLEYLTTRRTGLMYAYTVCVSLMYLLVFSQSEEKMHIGFFLILICFLPLMIIMDLTLVGREMYRRYKTYKQAHSSDPLYHDKLLDYVTDSSTWQVPNYVIYLLPVIIMVQCISLIWVRQNLDIILVCVAIILGIWLFVRQWRQK